MKRGALDYLVKDTEFIELVPEVVRKALVQVETEKRLVSAEATRKRLEEEILQISDLEQRRIGQDLHDGICQELAAIELMSQVLEQGLAKKFKAGAEQASRIAANVRAAISHTRDLARGLSPVVVESEGLMAALKELAANAESRFKVRCDFHCPGPVPVDDNNAATHLYRIAQEAVANAVKHSQAQEIAIGLEAVEDEITLTIADDGLGIAPHPHHGGMGLHMMRYRARVIGASLDIRRGPSSGTVVSCFFQNSEPPNTL